MASVLSVFIPIFGLIFLGWLLERVRILNGRLLKRLNDYVYYIGITAITFLSLHDTSTAVLFDPGIYALSLAPMLLTIAAAFAATRILRLPGDLSAIFIVCAFFGNTGYIGFPLNVIVQGREALPMAAFVSTIYTVVAFTLGAFILKRHGGEPGAPVQIWRLPVIWAALLGLLLSWIALPGIIRAPLEWIGDTTSPLALIATGAMAGGIDLRADLKGIGALSAIKLALAPALVALAGMALGSSGLAYRTALLEAATPVAVTNTILASRFRARPEFASSAVIATTALFAVTLAAILVWLP